MESYKQDFIAWIRAGNVHKFYTWSGWLKLRAQVLYEQHYECQCCKNGGKDGSGEHVYEKAETVHHIKPIRRYPELAMTKSNLVALCFKCHEKEHEKKKKPQLNEERW